MQNVSLLLMRDPSVDGKNGKNRMHITSWKVPGAIVLILIIGLYILNAHVRERNLDHRAVVDLRVELRNASTAQEAYCWAHGTYTNSIEALSGTTYGFLPSENIEVCVMSAVKDSYRLMAYHKKSFSLAVAYEGPGSNDFEVMPKRKALVTIEKFVKNKGFQMKIPKED
ncbi:hypothetical protein ACFL9T_18675 [Thermodesulfobacteriota bacterium]